MTWLEGYQDVETRLREFLSDYPDARVVPVLLTTEASEPGDVIVFRADVWKGDRSEVDAAGHAHQRVLAEPPKVVNKKTGEVKVLDSAPEWTSPWETAETSAIGRALANLGYAPKGKRPSREEISKASVAAVGSGPAAPEATLPSAAAPATDSKSTRREQPGEITGKEPASTEGAGNDPAVRETMAAASVPVPSSYSADPLSCTHRFPSGNPLKADAAGNCPKCGTNIVAAIEGTTADLEGGYGS